MSAQLDAKRAPYFIIRNSRGACARARSSAGSETATTDREALDRLGDYLTICNIAAIVYGDRGGVL